MDPEAVQQRLEWMEREMEKLRAKIVRNNAERARIKAALARNTQTLRDTHGIDAGSSEA